jgi:dipeptidyl aminopeptidase/acylaminoacyl peptidase
MAKRGMTSEDLLRITFVGDPQLSPDGDTVLFGRKTIEKNKYVTQLFTVDDHGTLRQWTSGEHGASNGRWSPDGKQIAFVAKRGTPGPQIYLISTDGGEARAITKLPEGSISTLKWSSDGKSIAFLFREALDADKEANKKKRAEENLSEPPIEAEDPWYRLDGDGYFGMRRYGLYIIDVETGKQSEPLTIAKDGEYTFDWHPTEAKLAVIYSPLANPNLGLTDQRLYLYEAGGQPTEVVGPPKGAKSEPRWSPDGQWIAWAGTDSPEGNWGTANTDLWLTEAATGASRTLSGHQKDYDLAVSTLSDTAEASFGVVLAWKPDGSGLFVQLGTKGETQIAFVPTTGGIEPVTSGPHTIKMGNVSPDGQRIAATYNTPTALPEVAWVEAELGTGALVPRVLTAFNQALVDEIEFVAPEELWLDSTEGTKVHGWVLRPAGEGPHPGILSIHGGPHAQYGWAFFHEFQVFVTQGYTVLYTNPRGSKGYGEAFTSAIKGDWGHRDWEDIQAATAWLQADPNVDSSKLAVVGGSYGGYMTNWVIGHTKAFACAVTDRCVSNMVSMWSNSDYPTSAGLYWPGRPDGDLNDIAPLWAQSPIAFFKDVTTPTLVIHSVGDLRCNIEQSDQVFHALQVNGVPSRYVRYPVTTSHGLSRSGPPDLRLHRLTEYLFWLERWLKPGA